MKIIIKPSFVIYKMWDTRMHLRQIKYKNIAKRSYRYTVKLNFDECVTVGVSNKFINMCYIRTRQ